MLCLSFEVTLAHHAHGLMQSGLTTELKKLYHFNCKIILILYFDNIYYIFWELGHIFDLINNDFNHALAFRVNYLDV